jgi:hypothetical protein
MNEAGEVFSVARGNNEHRAIRVKRGVIGTKTIPSEDGNAGKFQSTYTSSNVVFHGLSEVIS